MRPCTNGAPISSAIKYGNVPRDVVVLTEPDSQLGVLHRRVYLNSFGGEPVIL